MMNTINQKTKNSSAPTAQTPPTFITYDIETAGMNDSADALDALKGQIVCIGFKELGKEPTIFCGPDERSIVTEAWDYIISKKPLGVFIGFNTLGFDYPWLVKKGLKHCPDKVHDADPMRIPQADVRLILSNGDKYAKGSLKDYCDFFGIEVKTKGTGEDVTVWTKAREFEKIAEYNREDLIAEEALAKRVMNLKENAENDNH